jgi:hypothetical protein
MIYPLHLPHGSLDTFFLSLRTVPGPNYQRGLDGP